MNTLIERLQNFPGKLLLTGGFVRDYLLGIESNDYDFECFEIYPDNLKTYLDDTFGTENVGITGRGFPIYRVVFEGFDAQFALPRYDRKIGRGYTEFAVTIDPFMSLVNAAIRRDLTINSIYMNPFTGEIFDPLNGIQDLRAKILRPTGEHFCEDPVRVLRVGYFAAKFNFNWSALAVKYSRQLRDEFQYIEKEKIEEIFLKTAKTAVKPSQFLRFLREADWLKFFGRLAELEETPQNPRWHPEGNVFKHTCQVMDYYSETFGSNPVGFYSTMLHDYGKIHTTVMGNHGWIAPNHAEFSANYCSEVFDSINPLFRIKLKKEIIELCNLHMGLGDAPTPKAIRKLAFRLNDTSFLELWKLCASDQLSRISFNGIRPEGYEESYKNLLLWKQKFTEEMNKMPEQKIQRIVTGDTLISYGIQPGIEMGKLLNIFQQLQIDGVLTAENSAEIVPYILKENSHG